MAKRLTPLLRIAHGVTILGALAGVLAMVKMAGRVSTLASLITVWVLLPFVLASVALAKRPSSTVGTLALLASSCFGLVIYYDLLFPSSRNSSTAGLAFMFVPLWQTLACLLAIALSLGLDFFNATFRCPSCGGRLSSGATNCAKCSQGEDS